MSRRTKARSHSRLPVSAAPRAGARRLARWELAIVVGLCLLTGLAYSNAFSAGFALDNKQLILNDPRIHAATWDNARLILQRSYWWPYGESGLYRPFTTFSYLFNFAVLDGRDRPAGYHWFNLAVHTANVLLVLALVRRLTGQATWAAASAAIWAVLPTSTEAVTNIVGRADLLAAFGVLAGLWCYLGARESVARTRFLWCLALMAATTVGVFSKESAVTLIGVVLVYEAVWWSRSTSVSALAGAAIPIGLPALAMWVQRSSVL